MFKNKHLLLTITAIISILGSMFFLRWIFFAKADPEYLHDLYSFSQWSIPFSSRVMGDTALYQYSGIQLIKDFEPFKTNPETPVLGKILLGLSIKYTDNPHLVQFLVLGLLLISLNLIAKKFLKFEDWHLYLLLLLVATSPIIIEQIPGTLLDLPQAAFFLAHVLFLFLAGREKIRQKTFIYIILSGVFLGAMTASKIALYLPLIFLIDTWYLWKQKKLIYAIQLILTSLFSYAFFYSPYIIKYGPISWLKAQKWIINFYRISEVKQTPGMILVTILSGWYKGWWGTGWERVTTWSGSWTLGLVFTFLQIKKVFKNKQKITLEHQYLLITSVLIIALLTFIPFWARYLVFLVPLFWINTISILKNKKIILLLLFFPLIHTSILAVNTLRFDSSHFNSLWETASYQEMYDYFSDDYKSLIVREEWSNENDQQLRLSNVMSIMLNTTSITNVDYRTKKQTIQLKTTSPNKYNFAKYEVIWKLKNCQWKVDKIKQVSSEDIKIETEFSGFLCINPTKVNDWSDAYIQVGDLLNTDMNDIQKRTMSLSPRDHCIPIENFNEDQEKPAVPYYPGVFYQNFENI